MSSVVHDKLYIYWKQNYRFAVPVISQYFFLMKQERMSVSIARRKKKGHICEESTSFVE